MKLKVPAKDVQAARLEKLLDQDDRTPEEQAGLLRIMHLFATLPLPPDPYGLYPRYEEMRERFLLSIEGPDSQLLEESFLALYSHVHGYDVPYTQAERERVLEIGGHLCHIGGVSPILKAGPFLGPDTISGDFGAGNGLQGLLMQFLFPHRKTVQVEISSRMVEAGRALQSWMGIPEERVEWIVEDVSRVSPASMDFVYLYRPVRPTGEGSRFYESFAA